MCSRVDQLLILAINSSHLYKGNPYGEYVHPYFFLGDDHPLKPENQWELIDSIRTWQSGAPPTESRALVPNRNSQTGPANSGPKFVRNCREKIWAQKMVRNGRRETLNLGRLTYKQNNIAFMTLKQLSSIWIVYYPHIPLEPSSNYHPWPSHSTIDHFPWLSFCGHWFWRHLVAWCTCEAYSC